MHEALARNECRAFFALTYVAQYPGLSAWELSMKTGIPYVEFSKGLQKARERGWVNAQCEEREGGGIRYRYTAAETERQAEDRVNHRKLMERLVE